MAEVVEVAPTQVQEETVVVAPAAVEQPAPVATETTAEEVAKPVVEEAAAPAAAEEEVATPTKRPASDEEEKGGEDKPPEKKKARITQATIKKFLRRGKLLENQIFTWRDWEDNEDAEVGDVTFHGCKMKTELKNAAGEVVLKPKQSVRRVDWYTSKSIAIFYPTGSVAGSIICPLSIAVLPPMV